MPYEDLRSLPLEHYVEQVQALQAVASKGQVQSVAALAARCTIQLADSMGAVAGSVFDAKKMIATRLPELTGEMEALRKELASSSQVASEHTAALARWTKVLVVVTALYTLITGGLLLVAIRR